MMKSLSKLAGFQADQWKQVPRPLKIFFIRGICILVVWKCLYLFVLKPLHQPDRLLTLSTGQITAWLLSVFSPQMHPLVILGGDVLITALVHGKRINTISIADACNALELMVLYIGFIFSAPLPLGKQAPYICTGLLVILVTNVLRCLALAYIFVALPHFFPFAHHYIFTLTIYLITFLLWKRFISDWIKYETK